MTTRLAAAWRTRTPRERRLFGAIGIALSVGGVTLAAQVGIRDVIALRARVARAEHRLTTARVLAGRLEDVEHDRPDGARQPLVSLVEAAVVETVGTEPLARLEPGTDPDDATEAHLVDVELPDVIRVLAALENPSRRLVVRDLDLRRHPDERARYDVTLVVIRERRA